MQKSKRHINRDLLVPLTNEEREIAIKNLTDTIHAMSEVERKIEALKEEAKLHKGNLDLLSNTSKELSSDIKNGRYQSVSCEVRFDWDSRHVVTIRKDTWEIVEDRDMNEHDKPQITDEIEEPAIR